MKTIKLGLAALALSFAGATALAQTESNRSVAPPTQITVPDEISLADGLPEGAIAITDGQTVYIILGADEATLAALAELMEQQPQQNEPSPKTPAKFQYPAPEIRV